MINNVNSFFKFLFSNITMVIFLNSCEHMRFLMGRELQFIQKCGGTVASKLNFCLQGLRINLHFVNKYFNFVLETNNTSFM